MVKKRLIFTLLYNDGGFMLSRNFRLQRAGNIEWLKTNYDFKNIAFTIDELIILDVSRNERNIKRFCDHIKLIGEECFIPISAGGGITSPEHAKAILNSGADKLVVNSALYNKQDFIRELVSIYGSQCIIGSVDVKKQKNDFEIYIDNGSVKIELPLSEHIEHIISLGIGEIYINSMDKDGTGHGYMFDLLIKLNNITNVPIIIAGGAGNWHHLIDGLQHDIVDAVATANLFNFIGNGFPNARTQLLNSEINLAQWESKGFIELKNSLKRHVSS
ncbi:MAG: imidazole glycerol phosphate synthase cyclase subunit [Syntrophus sp. (in: bacteria)]|nr:imidazole glycerol phosphate synthase cyclase subunit [Syntrophus sp. (in: bacteria)]